MTELRVLHVIDNLSPGGTEKQCMELVRGLVGEGVQNAVIYFRAGPLLAQMERLGVTIRTVQQGSFRSARFPIRLMGLARLIRQWGPTVVQTYGFYSNVPGLLAAFFAGVPVRVAGRRDLGDHLRPAQRRADRLVRTVAHRVVANSEAVRQHLLTHENACPHKVVVIRNGLNLLHWPPSDPAVANHRSTVVGMVAHFRAQKDHATFLMAAREILKVVPSVHFSLVGSGPLMHAVRERAQQLGIAPHVTFHGILEGEPLRATMSQFCVSVLTSQDNEGMPNAVLESMAIGCPVVATEVGGTSEIIDDGVTGFLVPPRDPEALARRVISLLNDPSLSQAMAERARHTVEREFQVKRMVDQFHGLYRALLRERLPVPHRESGPRGDA